MTTNGIASVDLPELVDEECGDDPRRLAEALALWKALVEVMSLSIANWRLDTKRRLRAFDAYKYDPRNPTFFADKYNVNTYRMLDIDFESPSKFSVGQAISARPSALYPKVTFELVDVFRVTATYAELRSNIEHMPTLITANTDLAAYAVEVIHLFASYIAKIPSPGERR